jgi:hypothetical protein
MRAIAVQMKSTRQADNLNGRLLPRWRAHCRKMPLLAIRPEHPLCSTHAARQTEEGMTVAEQVYEQAKLLPEPLALEALDFVLFLRERQERGEWRKSTISREGCFTALTTEKSIPLPVFAVDHPNDAHPHQDHHTLALNRLPQPSPLCTLPARRGLAPWPGFNAVEYLRRVIASLAGAFCEADESADANRYGEQRHSGRLVCDPCR